MSVEDFGHSSAQCKGIFIDAWGTGPFVIMINDKAIRFEDSDRFGPLFVGKDGEPLEDQQLPETHMFWRKHMAWVNGGRKLGRKLSRDFTMCAI